MDFIISFRSSFYAHLGVLLACFTVDYRVLFEPLTEESIQDGFQYYKTFYNAPLGIKVQNIFFFHAFNDLKTRTRYTQALLHGLIGIGVASIIAKIHRWNETAMLFDGGSLGAYYDSTFCLVP
jgi:hypothetical protein